MATSRKGNIPINEENDPPPGKSKSDISKEAYQGGGRQSTDSPEISDDDQSTAVKEEDKARKWEFHGIDAWKMLEFFETTLVKIQHNYKASSERQPAAGNPTTLTIRCLSMDHYEKVKEAVDDLKDKLDQLSEEKLDVSEEDFHRVESFLEKQTKDKNEMAKCLLDQKTKSRLWIVSNSYEVVRTMKHRIQVCLGQKKVTNRTDRALSSAPSGSGMYENSAHDMSPRSTGAKNYQGSRPYDDRNSTFKYDRPTLDPYDEAQFRFEATLPGGMILKVYQASILGLKVDVIVNAANDTMAHGGGVARVIAEAAGYELNRESRKYVDDYGKVGVTRNIVTSAGNLHYTHVIHAVGPQWQHYHGLREECLKDVCKTVTEILARCDQKSSRSVAMPAISAGIFGVPKQVCADMYVKAAVDFSEKHSRVSFNPKELHIIDVDMEILELVKKSFEKWQSNPDAISPKESLKRYYDNPSSTSHSSSSSDYGSFKGPGGASNSSYGNRGGKPGTSQNSGPWRDSLSQPSDTAIEYKGNFRLDFGTDTGEEFFVRKAKMTVKIYVGSVARVSKMDAVVSGISIDLKKVGQVGEDLKNAGGAQYGKSFNEMKTYYRGNSLSEGQVLRCKGEGLRVGHVFYLVMGPPSTIDDVMLQKYQRWITNLLKEADKSAIQRIAIPLLGSGGSSNDENKVKSISRAFLGAILEYAGHATRKGIQELHLVNKMYSVSRALVEVFREASTQESGPRGKRGSGAESREDVDVSRSASETVMDWSPSEKITGNNMGSKEQKQSGNLNIYDDD